jgi:hypothetical protein
VKKTFIIRNPEDLRRFFGYASQWGLEKPVQIDVSLYAKKRNTEQNALLWARLTDISKQVEWHGQVLTKENWKDIFTSSLKRQRAVPGIDGGFVVLGTPTHTMTTNEFSDLLEVVAAFGAEHDVKWGDEN